MVSKKYNQFVQARMSVYQSDLEKLVHITNKIIEKFHYVAYRNKIILLDYNTSRFIKYCDSVTEHEFYTFRIHVPDIIYYKDGQLHIIEIDGWIHNFKQKVMDQIEMVQYMILLKQNHTLEFPPSPKGTIVTLENQFALFSEHKTEQGSMSYYSPGNELDNLTKSLILACFAARKYLRGSTGKHFATSVNMVSGGDELGSGLSGSQMSRGRDVQWDARNRRTAGRKFTIR